MGIMARRRQADAKKPKSEAKKPEAPKPADVKVGDLPRDPPRRKKETVPASLLKRED